MRWVFGLVVAVVLAATAAAPGRADVVWLCKPGLGSNPCVGDLEVTDAKSGDVRTPGVPANPPIDCFYVYPTVSDEPGPNASTFVGPELQAIAVYQAQQFQRVCRVFAPVYRQITVLARAIGGDFTESAPIAYADVRAAFQEYLRDDNGGRGFVLVGHSQGATMLRRLISDEVDGHTMVRRRLVSAILPGANVLVRRGEDAGGDFANVPACRRFGQAGCVAAWSTFDYTPPDDTKFGRPQPGGIPGALGLRSGDEYEVLCTNPAELAKSRGDRFSTLLPTQTLFPGIVGVLILQTFGGLPPSASTPWVRPADRYAGACASENGANFLRLRGLAGARRLKPAPDDTWGQHLMDVNLVIGNLIAMVRAQRAGYNAVDLRVRRRGRHTFVTVRTSPGSRVLVIQRLDDVVTARRTVSVPSGVARVRLPSRRLQHYTYGARRLKSTV